jgi:hypothetical protein
VDGGNGEERGGPGAAWDSAAARHRPAAARLWRAQAARRGTSRGRPNRGGADRWAATTVPGGVNSN